MLSDFIEDVRTKIGIDDPARKVTMPKKSHFLPELILTMHHCFQKIKIDVNITLPVELLYQLFI